MTDADADADTESGRLAMRGRPMMCVYANRRREYIGPGTRDIFSVMMSMAGEDTVVNSRTGDGQAMFASCSPTETR